ncbi:hypothetical protein ACFX13_043377 [Malus domestica]
MNLKPSTTTAPLLNQKNPNNPSSKPKPRDFLSHLEAYLAKRDGVDKFIKVSRYATKIVLASSVILETLPLTQRLKSFESGVGVSRKAYRLSKFIQDVNALRSSNFVSNQEHVLAVTPTVAERTQALETFMSVYYKSKKGRKTEKEMQEAEQAILETPIT